MSTYKRKYKDPAPTRAEDQHPQYMSFLEQESRLKHLLDLALAEISELKAENKELKKLIENNGLPAGKYNGIKRTLCD